MWRINVDVPEEGKSVSLDTGDGDRWWEQVDLKKLILASNKLKELSPDIKNLPALNVLDVRYLVLYHTSQLENICVIINRSNFVLLSHLHHHCHHH